MITIAIFMLIWGLFSVLALALAKSASATEEEYNDPGQPVTVWEIVRSPK